MPEKKLTTAQAHNAAQTGEIKLEDSIGLTKPVFGIAEPVLVPTPPTAVPLPPTCETCRFFVQPNDLRSECHRHAPMERGFPAVGALDWCGEYEGHPEEA
ncbi:hypothetical protein [Sulfobacillus harzensis]|uniref:Uncharacterized protein n=1 Tax=Sulfobacillus harzensis TaxID=2729629 RepID=A0A7Y0L7G1_9FIRM|nr:hypothetical protein [Sulfobacillus harzensis]NMP24621.1 hypothetical protein [Sulfobacillus harzensis]